jgi:hypothetical protein
MPSVQSALWGAPAPMQPPAPPAAPTRTRRELHPGDIHPSKAKQQDCAFCWDEQVAAQQHGTRMPRRRPVEYRVGTPGGERYACAHHAHQVAGR